jgi:hypothetical protein
VRAGSTCRFETGAREGRIRRGQRHGRGEGPIEQPLRFGHLLRIAKGRVAAHPGSSVTACISMPRRCSIAAEKVASSPFTSGAAGQLHGAFEHARDVALERQKAQASPSITRQRSTRDSTSCVMSARKPSSCCRAL